MNNATIKQFSVGLVALNWAVSAWAQPAPEAPAPPAVIGNVAFATQYIFRGLTQTSGKPAVQAGLDYAHASGLYLGTWLSNIAWYDEQNAGTVSAPVPVGSPGTLGAPYQPNKTNSTSLEWDLYGGYKASLGADWTVDVGVIRYAYPGRFDNVGAYRNPNTTELYGAVGFRWLTLKYSKGISADTFGAADSKGASYIDLSASVPIGKTGYTWVAHAGRQDFGGKANPGYWGTSGGSNKDYNYNDYKIGLGTEIAGVNVVLNWTYADTKPYGPDGETTAFFNVYGKNIGRGRLAVVATRNF
jgi:uncharacterized protein (TIGR02001 family)